MEISTPNNGMNQDLSILNLKASQYPYALNATISDFSGEEFIIQNTPSNILATVFPEGYSVISNKTIYEQNRVIYLLINPETSSYILGETLYKEYFESLDEERSCINGDCSDVYYEEITPLEKTVQKEYIPFNIIETIPCLNLNRDYPVDIEYKITDCGINLYFTDGLNPRRYIYLDYTNGLDSTLKIKQEFYKIIGFDLGNCNTPIYSTEIDCNKIDYNRCFEKPYIDFVDLTNLGSLKSGVYQFIFCYSDENGVPLTNYFPSSSTIPVFNKKTTTITDYQTDKAIVIDIKNIDNTSYNYYNLVVAETLEGFTEFKLIGTFPTNQNISNSVDRYTYSGTDKTLHTLSSQEIFSRKPYYSNAKAVTKSGDYLFYSSLDEYKPLNLQPVANNIRLFWQTIAIKESAYENARGTFKFRTYQRDEVYPFAIIFEYCDGYETCAFHIPGISRKTFADRYNIDVDAIIANNDVIDDVSCANNDLNKRWQVYNTAQVIPSISEYKFTNDCDETNCWEAGDFAYWESTEKYPNIPSVWGELCGEPIRHHKFPDSCVTHIHDGLCQNKGFTENNIVYPIGVRVDNASVLKALEDAVLSKLITAEERSKIVSYRIVRGDRAGNKSIVAKGLLYDMWQYTKDGKSYAYPNYPYNDLNKDEFLAPDKTTYDENPIVSGALPNQSAPKPSTFSPQGRYTFHSPDIHFVNPTLGSVLKLETVEYGKSEGFFNMCEEQAKYKRLSFFSRLIALGMGIAAALSATEEKDCVTYTVKGNYHVLEPELTNNYDLTRSETYPNVSGTLTFGSGSINTQSGTTNNLTTKGNTKTEDRTLIQDNTTCIGLVEADKKTGQNNTTTNNPIIQSAVDNIKACKNIPEKDNGSTEPDAVVEQYTKTTCRGTPHQLLSTSTDNSIMKALNTILNTFLSGAPQVLSQFLLGMKEMEIVLDLIRALIPEKNYGIQYNSVGKYNNYACVPSNIGIKQRSLFQKGYLESGVQVMSEPVGIASYYPTVTVNNLFRESSVFLAINKDKLFLKPQDVNNCVVADNSRTTMKAAGLDYEDINKNITRNIASYYASVKNYVGDQYGKIYNISYLETNSKSYRLDKSQLPCAYTMFGGDTFITRFALKRKHSFFLQTRFKATNGSDVRYSELGNAAFPNFYFDSQQTLAERFASTSVVFSILNPLTAIDEIVGLEKSRLDAKKTNVFYQKGFIHLYSYGIPYFFTESDINVDYRHGQNNLEKDFYPHNSNLNDWLQEKNVSPKEDNYYYYNKTFSKQNKESFICVNQSSYDDRDCVIKHPNRIIYSDQQTSNSDKFDNWLVFRTNNYYDVPLSDGKLITVDGIEGDKVLVRSENVSRVFNAYNLITTTTETIQVGTGGIFKSRPQDFAITDLGYAGTQHKDILHTEYGHIWVDAKRGNVFNLGTNASALDELSKNGCKHWFKQNLPFTIAKYFPTIDVDNNLKNIGITMCYDRRFNNIFITKKDYLPLSKDIKYNGTDFTVNDNVVSVKDESLFCDKSWTISFNLHSKSWVSFHSFKPSFYNYFIDTFQSGSDSSVWTHNETNKSYQVYNGKLYPFIIDHVTNQSLPTNFLNSVEYSLDTVRYHNQNDYFYNRHKNFNKAVIYNDHQCSGMLHLITSNPDDMSQLFEYPKSFQDRIEIESSRSENVWRFNDFHDAIISQNNNVPMWNWNCANDYKTLNQKAVNHYKSDLDKSRLRTRQCRVYLVNDIESNYKFMLNFNNLNQTPSIR